VFRNKLHFNKSIPTNQIAAALNVSLFLRKTSQLALKKSCKLLALLIKLRTYVGKKEDSVSPLLCLAIVRLTPSFYYFSYTCLNEEISIVLHVNSNWQFCVHCPYGAVAFLMLHND